MEYRMYFFVPYNISDIQKGIQAGHAALEYADKYGHTELFKEFVRRHKTWIILNGGSTRDEEYVGEIGDLNSIEQSLEIHDIPYAYFREPDLNFSLSALCFIADERIWNKELYPDWEEERTWEDWCNYLGGEQNAILRNLIQDKHLA